MTQLPPSKGFFEVQEADEALALQALGWILADEPRAERLLGTTGLTPERLRASLGQRTTLGAVLGFLTAHEPDLRSEEHTSELQSLMRISYAVFCLKKKHNIPHIPTDSHDTVHAHY